MRHTFSLIVLFFVVTLLSSAAAWQVQIAWGADGISTKKEAKMNSQKKKVIKSEEEWKKILTPEQYRILRQAGTERPFTGALNDVYDAGLYRCAACGAPLFHSDTKYDHGTGWPSFTAPIAEDALEYRDDYSYGMHRIEVRCAVCGSHLGHVFDDGPAPTGKHYCINSAAIKFEKATPVTGPQKATFAAGCFWGVEFKFSQVPGVISTRVGYTGGTTKNPTYEEVCTDKTGHAEAVEVTYDPAKVSYEKLLEVFLNIHDPTQIDRQGPDIGTQYRSAIFYHDEEQKKAAEATIKKLNSSGRFRRPIATQLVPADTFYPAEEYHQKYYQKRGKQGCGI